MLQIIKIIDNGKASKDSLQGIWKMKIIASFFRPIASEFLQSPVNPGAKNVL